MQLYNANARAEAPNQDTLIDASKHVQWTEEHTNEELKKAEHSAGPAGIDRWLEENHINIILGPADSWLTNPPCYAGRWSFNRT